MKNTYYNVGKLLIEAQGGEDRAKYGDGLIKEYSLKLSKEMTEAHAAGDEKGLSLEELAFYDALVADPEVLRNMKDSILIEMAHELTTLIQKSRTIDWDKKQSARAYMRTQIKHLLRKYKYPPDQAKIAIEVVIKQAELMSANIMPA